MSVVKADFLKSKMMTLSCKYKTNIAIQKLIFLRTRGTSKCCDLLEDTFVARECWNEWQTRAKLASTAGRGMGGDPPRQTMVCMSTDKKYSALQSVVYDLHKIRIE